MTSASWTVTEAVELDAVEIRPLDGNGRSDGNVVCVAFGCGVGCAIAGGLLDSAMCLAWVGGGCIVVGSTTSSVIAMSVV